MPDEKPSPGTEVIVNDKKYQVVDNKLDLNTQKVAALTEIIGREDLEVEMVRETD